MTPLSPTGTARGRFLATSASPGETGGESSARSPDDEQTEAVYLGWEVARCACGLSKEDERALASLAAACIASVLSGSTRMPIERSKLSESLARVGAADAVPEVHRLLDRARAAAEDDPVVRVIGRPGERKPLILGATWVSTERMQMLEERFCARVLKRVTRVEPLAEARGIARAVSAVSTSPVALTDEQKRAVRDGLRSRLALITGGPGTGKTSTVVAIVRAMAWMGIPTDAMAIAAPTGKAAQRLSESLAAGVTLGSEDIAERAFRTTLPPPLTLHRLLGWSPSSGRFARHENDPLPHRVVVIDEASMIDLAMMDRLFRAIREDARLVLVGDADQLPSVDAGAVFRDLCTSLRASRLTVNLRVARDAGARTIVSCAQAVNAGRIATDIARRETVDTLAFDGVEHIQSRWSEQGEALLDRWWRERFACDGRFLRALARCYRMASGQLVDDDRDDLLYLLGHHGRARILCGTRFQGHPACAEGINDSLLWRLRSHVPPSAAWSRRPDLVPGTPVIVQRNDYARGLFNGDQGVIVQVDLRDTSGVRLMAAFLRGGVIDLLPAEAIADLAPAFAMTVHKAQGSEFDHVALVLPDADVPLLTRELIYTAVTRARRSVLIFARPELLVRAVERTAERTTGLAELLSRGL